MGLGIISQNLGSSDISPRAPQLRAGDPQGSRGGGEAVSQRRRDPQGLTLPPSALQTSPSLGLFLCLPLASPFSVGGPPPIYNPGKSKWLHTVFSRSTPGPSTPPPDSRQSGPPSARRHLPWEASCVPVCAFSASEDAKLSHVVAEIPGWARSLGGRLRGGPGAWLDLAPLSLEVRVYPGWLLAASEELGCGGGRKT